MLPRPIVVSVVLLVAIAVIGLVGFMAIEGWSPFDALWMVVITLTTIGFGEIHPLSPPGRAFTIGLILAGVSVGTYAMGSLTQMIVEGQLQEMLRQRRRRKQMKALWNHFIVVGYGRLGQAIAEELHASGVPVCVVEMDAEKVKAAEAHRLYPVVQGDGANDDVLRLAGVERARGIAVAVDASAQAVYVTLSARELNPKLTIVTRVDDTAEALKARRAGASSVVSPYTMGGWRMAHELIRPHATSFVDLLTLATHGDVQLQEFAVVAGSPLVGASLAELRLSDDTGAMVVAIRRADGALVPAPRGPERFQVGDVLIAIGTATAIQKLAERVPGEGPA